MLTVDEALAAVLVATPALAVEPVSLWDAHGRFLGSPLRAPRPLPAWDHAAMDGYAAAAASLPGVLPVVGEVAAGRPRTAPVPPGGAVRILTGAPLPPGVDTVVIQEDAAHDGDAVRLPASPAGANVRRAGEDVEAGALALAAGRRLDAGGLALAAALGAATVEVRRRPTVAVLATGDELVDVATAPAFGQLVDSSAHALRAMVREAGGEPRYLGRVGDDRAATAEAIARALAHDVVLTTGGVSAGAHDHVRGALADAGVELRLWKVAMKPGKPVAFGVRARQLVFGLPGNPVSTVVAFELFVRPALLALQGASETARPRAPVVLPDGYRKPAGRAHYLRAQLRRDGERLVADVHRRQGSAMLGSMPGLHALLEIPAASTGVPPGGTADALLLEAR